LKNSTSDEHYAPVGAALIWTLEQGLGDSFTDETREAWLIAYTAIAETMKAGAANSA
jgi:nitric oxide dioxygenase